MTNSKFAYTIYIRTSPEKLWQAMTEPQLTSQYWWGSHQESTWEASSSWRLATANGVVTDSGHISEIEPLHKLVLKWRNEFRPELHDEGFSVMTLSIEKIDDAIKLSITHEMDKPQSKFIAAVAQGWPSILSSLKSLLETGKALAFTSKLPES